MKEHKDEEIYFAHQYGVETAAMVCPDVLDELEELFKAPKHSFEYGQIVDGLKKIGIDHVYNEDYAKQSSNAQAAELLDKLLGKDCLILAEDYAARSFLEKYYPELKARFAFYDSPQRVFAELMHKTHPGAKLYHIAGRNSFGAEARETGAVDYFINARELYRIFLRTGVAPAKRRGVPPEPLAAYEPCRRYEALLNAGEWSFNGELEELRFEENGNTYTAAICTKLGQVKAAVENMDKYDVIKVIG